MKRHLKSKSILLLLIPALSACGYSLREIYPGSVYNSAIFAENYYNVWDKKLDESKTGHSVVDGEKRALPIDRYFTRWDDSLFKNYEEDWDSYYYAMRGKGQDIYDGKYNFGYHNRLSNIDSSFKYGVISKLFDGQAFCHGDYTKARVQVAPKHETDVPGYHIDTDYRSGFAHLFSKQYSGGSTYFAFNFKASIEMNQQMIEWLGFTSSSGLDTFDNCLADITIDVNLYIKDGTHYVKNTYSLDVDNVHCNGGGISDTDVDVYSFVGFPLNVLGDEINIDNLVGVGFEYKLNSVHDTRRQKRSGEAFTDDEFIKKMEEFDLHYGLWLYEIFMPHSTWH